MPGIKEDEPSPDTITSYIPARVVRRSPDRGGEE
jgi:hypothetical protein